MIKPPDGMIFFPGTARPTEAYVDFAGEVLRTYSDRETSVGQAVAAYTIIEEWRPQHQAVIDEFRSLLGVVEPKNSIQSVVAGRLKRLPTILEKIMRFPDLPLSAMQDTAGIRAIVQTRDDVFRLRDSLPANSLHFTRLSESDYMKRAKKSGYSGLHLIYRYGGGDDSLNGLKIEIQLRTGGQHAWATTNEVVGTFRREQMKSGIGHPDWLRLFVLAGSAIAEKDGGKRGRNVPENDVDFIRELNDLKTKLNVFDVLSAYTIAEVANMFALNSDPRLYLLYFNLKIRKVQITEFGLNDATNALTAYREREKEHDGDPAFNTVLVSSDSVAEMRRAYSNCFADTREFTSAIYSALEIAGKMHG